MWSRIDSPLPGRLTRRSATVTISAPDSSWACRMTSSDPYFPVPTIRRDENSLPPITSDVSMAILLSPRTATHRPNHLDAVPILEPDGLELVAARDLAVHGDGGELALHAEGDEEAVDAEAVRHLHRLAVHRDLHTDPPVAKKQNDRAQKRVRPWLSPCSLRWDYPDQVRGVPGRTRFSGILPPRRQGGVYHRGLDPHLDDGGVAGAQVLQRAVGRLHRRADAEARAIQLAGDLGVGAVERRVEERDVNRSRDRSVRPAVHRHVAVH